MFYTKIERIPIYNSFLLRLIVSDDVEKINQETESNDERYFACAFRSNHKNEIEGDERSLKGVTVVLNPNDDKLNPITAGVITHESLHVMNMIFKQIGYTPKTNNDEAAAYFLEWIVDYITKYLEECLAEEKKITSEEIQEDGKNKD